MMLKDITTLIIRLFASYHAYLFVMRLVRFFLIIASRSYPDHMRVADVAMSNLGQSFFSLAIAVSLFKWSDRISNILLMPTMRKEAKLTSKNAILIIIALSGLYTALFALPEFATDLAIYIDYTRHAKEGVTILTAQTMGFGLQSNRSPIFSVIFDLSRIIAGTAMLFKSKQITAYIIISMNDNTNPTKDKQRYDHQQNLS